MWALMPHLCIKKILVGQSSNKAGHYHPRFQLAAAKLLT
jgi:hypothetical protein